MAQQQDPAPGIETYHDFLNYEVVERSETFVRLRMDGYDCHRNRKDYIHGGIVMSLMDIAGIMAGHQKGRKSVTVNLMCNFLSSAFSKTVIAEGEIIRQGRSMYFSDVRVIEEETGKKIASGQGVYKFIA